MQLIGHNRRCVVGDSSRHVAVESDQGVRYLGSRRGLLLRMLFGMVPVLALIIFLSIAASRTRTPLPEPKIASYLLPGQSLPKAASCEIGDPDFRYLKYCEVIQDGDWLVRLTYDQRTQTIRNTSFRAHNVTVGALIIVWGDPKTYRQTSGMIQMYWDEKSALLSTPLTPASAVSTILYGGDIANQPLDQIAWHGFVTVDRHNAAIIAPTDDTK